MLRGVKKLNFKFTLTMAAYDLIKLPRLIGVIPILRKSDSLGIPESAAK
jgi:hypothetical protein